RDRIIGNKVAVGLPPPGLVEEETETLQYRLATRYYESDGTGPTYDPDGTGTAFPTRTTEFKERQLRQTEEATIRHTTLVPLEDNPAAGGDNDGICEDGETCIYPDPSIPQGYSSFSRAIRDNMFYEAGTGRLVTYHDENRSDTGFVDTTQNYATYDL